MVVRLKLKGKVYDTDVADFSIEVQNADIMNNIMNESMMGSCDGVSRPNITTLNLGVFVESKCEIECLVKKGKTVKCEVAVIDRDSISVFKFKKAEIILDMINYDYNIVKVGMTLRTVETVKTTNVVKEWWM